MMQASGRSGRREDLEGENNENKAERGSPKKSYVNGWRAVAAGVQV